MCAIFWINSILATGHKLPCLPCRKDRTNSKNRFRFNRGPYFFDAVPAPAWGCNAVSVGRKIRLLNRVWHSHGGEFTNSPISSLTLTLLYRFQRCPLARLHRFPHTVPACPSSVPKG